MFSKEKNHFKTLPDNSNLKNNFKNYNFYVIIQNMKNVIKRKTAF